MRKCAVLATILLLALAAVPSWAGEQHWRLGGSYAMFGNSSSRDAFGNGWGIGCEYSFTDRLEEDDPGGDMSVAVWYKRFNKDLSGTERTTELTSFSLKWRGGPGARPCSDGFYGGGGVGAALVSMNPTAEMPGQPQGVVKLELSGFVGCNFARSFFGEAGYSMIANVNDLPFSYITGTIGFRF